MLYVFNSTCLSSIYILSFIQTIQPWRWLHSHYRFTEDRHCQFFTRLIHMFWTLQNCLFVFSTWQLLDVLESYCMAEGLDYSRLDGTTKSKERVQIVKEFNSSSHINLCLVSTMLVCKPIINIFFYKRNSLLLCFICTLQTLNGALMQN